MIYGCHGMQTGLYYHGTKYLKSCINCTVHIYIYIYLYIYYTHTHKYCMDTHTSLESSKLHTLPICFSLIG